MTECKIDAILFSLIRQFANGCKTKQMTTRNRRSKLIAVAFALMIVAASSAFLIFENQTTTTASGQISSDMLQYEWPSAHHDPQRTLYNPGPGPAMPNLKWTARVPGATGYPVAFNGMVFVGNGSWTYALNGATGAIVWKVNRSGSMTKIDSTYMMIGAACVRISDGSTVWVGPSEIGSNLQTFSYGVGYVPELKMFMPGRFGGSAWRLSDPSQPPTLAWNITDKLNVDIGFPVYGDGKFFLGSNDGFLKAFDARTGEPLWTAPSGSMFFYSLVYYEGKVIHGGLDNWVRAWNATNGQLIWTYNPYTYYGQWSLDFAAAHGMIYGKNQDTYLYAINATNGELVWRQKGPGIGYANHVTMAGDKIYTAMGEYQYRDFVTGEYAKPEFSCFDAFTGKLLWTIPIENQAPSNQQCNAYGNLYMIPTKGSPAVPGYWAYGGGGSLGEVWCISSETVDWSMFMRDPEHTARGAGPQELEFKWKFTTGAQVHSSPTISNGVVYFGSLDGNIYAVGAENGQQIWNYTIGTPIVSSVAVVNGKVYTGADDGNIYCLDAITGAKLWNTSAGGISKNILWNSIAVVYVRSSPAVSGGRVYVGSLDGNLYCLDANNGNVIWKRTKQKDPYTHHPR
ncbi:MAG: PQQ-binding-like beta-propeller repeat protein [Candidatus Bathyarchaeota archaeon]|nr:PQQ-binding-like beta-propeller repeat protein [Candidatus Bathyarchaeota archaeon]